MQTAQNPRVAGNRSAADPCVPRLLLHRRHRHGYPPNKHLCRPQQKKKKRLSLDNTRILLSPRQHYLLATASLAPWLSAFRDSAAFSFERKKNVLGAGAETCRSAVDQHLCYTRLLARLLSDTPQAIPHNVVLRLDNDRPGGNKTTPSKTPQARQLRLFHSHEWTALGTTRQSRRFHDTMGDIRRAHFGNLFAQTSRTNSQVKTVSPEILFAERRSREARPVNVNSRE